MHCAHDLARCSNHWVSPLHCAPPPTPTEYQAAEGQKERRLLLSELRNLVPPSHAPFLVPILLDSDLAVPPLMLTQPLATSSGSFPSCPPASSQAQNAAEGAPRSGAAAAAAQATQRQQVARERAAAAARAAVLRQYSALEPLLLLEAVERLCDPILRGEGGGWASKGWLQGPRGSDGSSSGAGGGGGCGGSAAGVVERSTGSAAAPAAAAAVAAEAVEAAGRALAWLEALLAPRIAAAAEQQADRWGWCCGGITCMFGVLGHVDLFC